MKQLLTLIFFFIAIPLLKAEQNSTFPDTIVNKLRANQAILIAEVPHPRDTTFVPEVNDGPLMSFQNIIYKRRLDSIKTDIPMDYNEYVQSYIDIYTAPNRKPQIAKMLGLAKYYFPIYEKAFHESGVPEEIKYLSIVESALNPHAVSRVGATGPWQFMFTTAKGYGLDMNNFVDERKDPIQASYAAAAYLKDAYNEFGDWLLAIASYNCGKGNVLRAMNRSGANDFWGIRDYLPAETRGYVPAFIGVTYIMNYYKNHDIVPVASDFPSVTDTVMVDRFVSLDQVAEALNLNSTELVALNPAYKKRIVNGTNENPRRLIIPLAAREHFSALYETLNNLEGTGSQKIIAAKLDADEKPKAATAISYHKVKRGESLSNVADVYNIEVQDLKVWNNLRSIRIVPGQQLKIKSVVKMVNASSNKAKTYITYKVRKGDTLSTIAEKFDGVTIQKIKVANNLKGSAITTGMLLKIDRV
ncbi:MAG: transglycosylase SLT domain-containing protein [Sphingobacteriaceae bacterium]